MTASNLPYPVVSAENIFESLDDMYVSKRPRLEPDPVPLEIYKSRNLSEEQKAELKYTPQSEAIILKDPKGQAYTSFRTKGKNGTSVFTLLPDDLVVICAEFKGGLEEISLLPPGGQLKPDESPEDCGKREFENETGICLDRVICLNKAGTGPNFRQMYLLDYPCLGIVTNPLVLKPPKLGRKEFMQIVLIPLQDWLYLIEENNVIMEMHSIEVTYMALRKLGRLKLV